MNRLAAILAIVGLSGVGALAPTPAQAATCEGVLVVVDFHQLGGGVQTACDQAGGGKNAAQLFSDNGFALSYVQQVPGFVCKVKGVPANQNCVNTPPSNAYWGLFWADADDTSWKYSSLGVGALSVTNGSAVAFSWQGTSGTSLPGAATPGQTATSTPTPTPKPNPSSTPTPTPNPTPTTKPSVSAVPQTPTEELSPTQPTLPSGSTTKGGKPSASPAELGPRPSASASLTTAAAGGASPKATEEDSPTGALPVWVPLGALTALVALGAGLARSRRAQRGS